jgi:Sap, sulfolipid-1-addressing protein
MGELLLELVPFALGLAVTPAAVAAGILFLGSRRPTADDVAFIAPFVLVYAAIATAVLVANHKTADPLVDAHGKAVGSLLVGLLLLALAGLAEVRHRRHPDAPHKAGLVDRIDGAGPRSAFGIGLVLAVLNPNVAILLGGLAAVTAADVALADELVGAAFLVLSSVALLVGPLVWYLVRRESAERGLARIKAWLGRHQRAVNLGVLVVFGVIFTLKGLAGL